MESRKVRIGIIGAGQIARYHMQEYSHIADVEVVAVCDTVQAKAQELADQFGVAHVFSDYHEMLKLDTIEAVDVCLHNAMHAPVSIDALNAGKHVYCEKPIADSYANGAAMLKAARENDRMLHIQLGHIYRDYARAAKRLVDGGALGDVYHARCIGMRRRGRPYVDGYGSPLFVDRKNSGGGSLMDVSVYKIALLLYLLGMPKPTRITGAVYQKIPMNEERRKESAYNVEELATGFIRFENDLTMELFDSWAVHLDKCDPLTVLGTKGGVKFSPEEFSFHTTLCDLELDCTGNLADMDKRWRNTEKTENCYISSQAHWVAALQGKVPLLPTAQLALDTMLIMQGVYLSAKLGREVSTEEVMASC